jgi:hypothetical protein
VEFIEVWSRRLPSTAPRLPERGEASMEIHITDSNMIATADNGAAIAAATR